ncbi:MAG: FtsW/RodA/SpoVE family cell cycle protein [Armatimonadetes bacterium]|nr:FtsW/RodA/SpoVE family cell cycle protein [Armatimonadota bacterium]
MTISATLLLLLALLALGGLLASFLSRGARSTEGRILALLVPLLILLSVTALHARRDDLLPGQRMNLNDPGLTASALADATGVHVDLAQTLLAYRDALPGRSFRSMGQIPSLGRAKKEEIERLDAWAKEKDWKALQAVVRTGKLDAAPATPGERKAIAPEVNGDEDAVVRAPERGRGLYPDLDLRTRAAMLLPNPPFLLSSSTRSALYAALGEAGVVQRVVQGRTLEDRRVQTLSDVPAVPLNAVALRSPRQAQTLFVFVAGLLIALLFAGHFILRATAPQADELLWPLFGGLSALGVVMLFAIVPPLTARGTPRPFLGVVPEYAEQGFAVAFAMLLLPAALPLLRASERIGRTWLAGLLGALILIPNVLVRWGWGAVILLLVLLIGAAAYGLHLKTGRSLPLRIRKNAEEEGESVAPAQLPALRSLSNGRQLTLVLIAIFFLAFTVILTAARVAGGQAGYAPLVEISKVLLILFTARICSDYELFLGEGLGDLPARPKWELIGCWAAAMLLALLSNDLGFLLLLWIPFALLLSLSIGRKWPAFAGLVGLLAGALLLTATGQTRFPERMAGWLDPWHAPSTQMAEAFQRMASVPSVLAGTGIGDGTRLAISTDTRDVILPLYYEQWGWAGTAFVMALLLLAMHRLFRVGLRARETYAQWVALGFACVFAVQTVYMVGAGFGAWPLTGMTLAPLASGKAAAFFTLVMALLALAASAEPVREEVRARRGHARFVASAFGVFAVLFLYSGAKLAKTAVAEKERTALRPIDGAPNRRIVAELSELRTGRILAREGGTAYAADNLASLAYTEMTADGERRRRYPLGAPSFPVTGVLTEHHRTGGEAAWRSRLTGLDAFLDRSGIPLPTDVLRDRLTLDLWRRKRHPLWPREGRIAPQDVQTTLVTEIQEAAYGALKSHLQDTRARSGARPRKGAILLADVRTGEVLAYAQYPAPNPEAMARNWEAWDQAARDPAGYLDANGHLIDLVRNTDRAPGSTAKINTMIALSEDGKSGRTFMCRPGITVNGQTIRDHNDANHGRVGIREILKYSCNRGAAQAGAAVGPEALLEQYRRLRYRLPAGSGESPESRFHDHVQQIAFGQAMSANLWELATSAAAVARGGEAIELHLLKRNPELVEKWRVTSPETAARVAEGMRAVTEPGGTAWAVYRGRHDWPSKTGSAEVAGAKETDAWFVGYAPRENPAVVFVAWAEEDGTGGDLARALDLPGLIEKTLRSMGIVEAPKTPRRETRRRARRSRPVEPREPAESAEPAEREDPMNEILERARPFLDRRELQEGREFIEDVEEKAAKAREGLERFQEQVARLRAPR